MIETGLSLLFLSPPDDFLGLYIFQILKYNIYTSIHYLLVNVLDINPKFLSNN